MHPIQEAAATSYTVHVADLRVFPALLVATCFAKQEVKGFTNGFQDKII